jgi:hypothetical protein
MRPIALVSNTNTNKRTRYWPQIPRIREEEDDDDEGIMAREEQTRWLVFDKNYPPFHYSVIGIS